MTSLLHSIKENIGIGAPSFSYLKKKYTTPESNFLAFEGMQLHYRVTGEGPALLLIHGIGSSLHTWKGWHKELSNQFTVVSIDNVGFGLTGPHPKGDYSYDMYARCYSKLLDHLNITKAHIAGNSLGGIMTWMYALNAPERVNKIILMDAVGFNTQPNDLSDLGFKLSIHPLSKDIARNFTPKWLIKSSYSNTIYDQSLVTEENVDTYFDLFRRAGNRKAFSYILKHLIANNEDYTSQIQSIQQPTLIMWGEEDNLINVGDVKKFKQAIPHAEVVVYPKVGHLPMEEVPEQSARDTARFLLD